MVSYLDDVPEGQPPAKFLGLQDASYMWKQARMNPGKARKAVLHKMAPSLFPAPIKRSKLNHALKQKKVDKARAVELKKTAYRKFKIRNMEKLGAGGFGVIYKAECLVLSDDEKKKEKGVFEWQRCAVKRVNVSKTKNVFWNAYNYIFAKKRSDLIDALNEIAVLKKLADNKYILQYKGDMIKRGKLYIATELCSIGDLAELLEKSSALPSHRYAAYCKDTTPRFPIPLVNIVMAPIMDAVVHMHDQGFIHKDIKPQNILLTADGTPKLCDFGTAVAINKNEQGIAMSNAKDMNCVGSEYYMAPENIIPHEYNHTVDTWQVGMTMLVLCFGWSPYHFRRQGVYFRQEEVTAGQKTNLVIQNFYHERKGRGNKSFQHFIFYVVQLLRPELDSEHVDVWRAFRNFLRPLFLFHKEEREDLKQTMKCEYIAPYVDAWKTGDFSKVPEARKMFEEVLRSVQ